MWDICTERLRALTNRIAQSAQIRGAFNWGYRNLHIVSRADYGVRKMKRERGYQSIPRVLEGGRVNVDRRHSMPPDGTLAGPRLASTFEEAAQPRGPRKNTYVTSHYGCIKLTFQPKVLLISALAVDESEQGDVQCTEGARNTVSAFLSRRLGQTFGRVDSGEMFALSVCGGDCTEDVFARA
ncbi:hypothetical protein BJ912DRAFT_927129 [Pholiota molesta]|nr:hypothetical protein BJ912DRAFT_927129 [Pholiota molesta]